MSASNLCIPPHSKNEDFHADIAAKPFADQRAYHHGTYCIKAFSSQSKNTQFDLCYWHNVI